MSNNSTRWGPTHTNDNLTCAIDIRIGGTDPDRSDLLEFVCLPVNHSYRLHPHYKMFQIKMRPAWKLDRRTARVNEENEKEYTESHLDQIGGFGLFERWFEETLQLKKHKKIMPLVFDWGWIRPYLLSWMGPESFAYYFHESVRDCLSVLNFVNDRQSFWGEEVTFKHPTFEQFVCRSGVTRIEKNSTSSNAFALVECYRKAMGLWMPGLSHKPSESNEPQ